MNLLCAKIVMGWAVASGSSSPPASPVLPQPQARASQSRTTQDKAESSKPRDREAALEAKRTQFIRTNAPRFWSFASAPESIEPLKDYVTFQGVIAGDPNLGNFAPSLVKTAGGRQEMRYVDIDFDDAGQGSFALNITLFAANLKLMSEDVKLKEILEAYQSGLEGEPAPLSPLVKDLLSLTVPDYEEKLDELVSDKSEKGHFKFEAGSIEPYQGPYSHEEIAALFPSDKILDLAIRRKKVGGSMRAQRIWILTEAPNGKIKIMELKEVLASALELFRPQKALPLRLKDIYKNLWPGLSPESYQVVQMSDQRAFWLRRKSAKLIEAPYLIRNEDDLEHIRALAIYDAHLMGKLDGAQEQGQALKKEIQKDPKKFREAIKKTMEKFLEQTKASAI